MAFEELLQHASCSSNDSNAGDRRLEPVEETRGSSSETWQEPFPYGAVDGAQSTDILSYADSAGQRLCPGLYGTIRFAPIPSSTCCRHACPECVPISGACNSQIRSDACPELRESSNWPAVGGDEELRRRVFCRRFHIIVLIIQDNPHTVAT